MSDVATLRFGLGSDFDKHSRNCVMPTSCAWSDSSGSRFCIVLDPEIVKTKNPEVQVRSLNNFGAGKPKLPRRLKS